MAILPDPHEPSAVVGMPDSPTPLAPNRLSPREMDSLRAICDTFLPSLDAAADSTRALFSTSASTLGVPHRVGVFLGSKLQHPKLWLLRAALWLLSTWYGTLAICGARSLSWRFPHVRRFSEVEARRREEILLAWAGSWFFLYRMLFRALKSLVLLSYFTQVDDENQNPTWDALGYCGPDPNLIQPTSDSEKPDNPLRCKTATRTVPEEPSGPLSGSILHLHQPKQTITSTLSRHGLNLVSGARPIPTIFCDAVVLGSGSGGGVVAGVLAKLGYKVVVLDKGPHCARGDLPLLEGHALETMYEGGGLVATNDMGLLVLAGSTVGGGSHINWSASLRTPEHVLREWCSDYELELFGSRLYREAMDAVCERMGVQDDVAGVREGLSNAALRRGCEELGYAVRNIPRNSASDHDCGWCGFGCREGRKKGTPETWLADAAESGNAVILPDCRALEVVVHRRKGGRRRAAGGVVFEYIDGRRFAVEAKVTVVACGALNTPGLLRRSGLANGNIGRNLRLHPVVMGWGTFPEEEAKTMRRSYEGAIMTAMTKVGNDEFGVVVQTPSLHPGLFSVVMPWVGGGDFKQRMTRFSRTAHVFALARDAGGGGRVTPSGVEYAIDGGDERRLQRGLESVLRILAAAGAEEIGTHHNGGGRLRVKEVSFHEFERFVMEQSRRPLGDLSTPVCSAHQMGSCRMGVDPETSAVRPTGETWEVERLFVADASVLPTALGVNPMVTVQSIAYCTALSVLDVLRRSHARSRT